MRRKGWDLAGGGLQPHGQVMVDESVIVCVHEQRGYKDIQNSWWWYMELGGGELSFRQPALWVTLYLSEYKWLMAGCFLKDDCPPARSLSTLLTLTELQHSAQSGPNRHRVHSFTVTDAYTC